MNPRDPFGSAQLATECLKPLSHDSKLLCVLCGEGEIRTHEALSGSAVFKTAAINHSATSPQNTHSIHQPMYRLVIRLFFKTNLMNNPSHAK